MNWQEYELLVFDQIKNYYKNADFEFNSMILGKYSEGLRQCDIIIKQKIGNEIITILIDAKYYSKKLDVKAVENFISMANDINAHQGILISPKGYSELAYNRAENDNSNIVLDILNLDELKFLQGMLAIPYSGEYGVLMLSPFGWIIDAKKRKGMIALSYRKGFTFEDAANQKEFMYFNIWDKQKDFITAYELLKTQEENIHTLDTLSKSTITESSLNGIDYVIRKTIVKEYPAIEYACAIDHGKFIFFGIMFSPKNRETVNLNKLIKVITGTLPITIKHKDNKYEETNSLP